MSRKVIETFNDTTARSLTSGQSGALIYIDTSSGEVNVSLPPPEAGLNYEFVISHSSTNANDFILKSVNSSYVHTALMFVGILGNTISKTITLTSSSQSNLCDRLVINSNGTNWFVTLNVSTIANYSLTN